MITRAEAVKIVNDHLDYGFKGELSPLKSPWGKTTKASWHYGRCEVRALLDAIYGGPPDPKCLEEHIKAGS